MMVARQLRNFQSNKEAGQKRPGRLRVLESRASAPKLHQKHSTQKQKPLPDKPPLGSQAEGFTKPMSSEPAPSHRPGSAHWARPRHAEPYPIMPVTKLIWANRILVRAASSFLPILSQAGKTTVECQNACEKAQTRGCCRSAELLIVVPRPSWCNIFLQKTWQQRKTEKDETTKSFEQQSN